MAAAVLGVYVVASLLIGPRVLLRGRWLDRCPRLGVASWLAWLASIVLSVVGAAAVLVAVTAPQGGLAWLIRMCLHVFVGSRSLIEPTAVAALGLAVIGAVLLRLVTVATSVALDLHRHRCRHRDRLALVARPWGPGAVLVDHSAPVAYCLPGGPQQIVISTGTGAMLEDGQLAAILAHERSHLAGRHHWVLFAADALVRAFPLPALATARRELGVLLEMVADDVAGRSAGRQVVASALVTMASAAVVRPRGTLAAAELETPRRIRRLLAAPAPLARGVQALAGVGLILLVAVPLATSSLAVQRSTSQPEVYCPTSSSSPAVGAGWRGPTHTPAS